MDSCHGSARKYRAFSTLPLTVRLAFKARPNPFCLAFSSLFSSLKDKTSTARRTPVSYHYTAPALRAEGFGSAYDCSPEASSADEQ
jgi:hypothetical protein